MTVPDYKKITVLSVSFNSAFHLKRLFKNLMEKADQSDKIQFLVVDNTNGEDENLSPSFDESWDVSIIKNEGRIRQRSKSHAAALDVGLKNITSEFTLIVDPDIYVFKIGWDTFCLKQMSVNEKSVIGAPYPQWKLGKVHNFPSVVFMFFQTRLVQSFGKTFYPFPAPIGRIWNSVVRKIVRLGGIANKKRLDQFSSLRAFCGGLEKLTGITSPDTGKEIVEQFHSNGFQAVVFETPYESDCANKGQEDIAAIAKDFEIYIFDHEPIITHMYSSGVYHWQTEKGNDIDYWLDLIHKVEY